MGLISVFLSGIVGAVVGAFLGGRIQSAAVDRQTQAVDRQTAADQEGRVRASSEAAESARLDRLERGVAEMRGAALALVFEVQLLGGMSSLFRPRALVLTSMDRMAGHLAPMVEASTAVKVNGDEEMAALADALHEETMEVMAWLRGRAVAWRKDDVPTAGVDNAAIDLERAMRQARGLPPLPPADAPPAP